MRNNRFLQGIWEKYISMRRNLYGFQKTRKPLCVRPWIHDPILDTIYWIRFFTYHVTTSVQFFDKKPGFQLLKTVFFLFLKILILSQSNSINVSYKIKKTRKCKILLYFFLFFPHELFKQIQVKKWHTQNFPKLKVVSCIKN